MTTPVENIRAARAKRFQRAREMGIDLAAERAKPGSTQRTLAHAATRLINDPVPRQDDDDFRVDEPPAGAFNGVNTGFVLSGPVRGRNVVVIFSDVSAGTTTVLRRSDATPPAADEFYFDQLTPTQFVMGVAPDAGDALIAVFKPLR